MNGEPLSAHESSLIPRANVSAYSYLYLIEVILRELIIELLGNLDGPRWYRKRLPADILEKYKRGFTFERSNLWHTVVPLHPMYYIDFADLRKILERDDNWGDAFKRVFGSRKEFFANFFHEAEFIRNRVAHNRKATDRDCLILREHYSKLLNCIGNERCRILVSRCSSAPDIPNRLAQLQIESEQLFRACKDLVAVPPCHTWLSIKSEWWFDESYLQQPLEPLEDYFHTIQQYCSIPRNRGTGHLIEKWVRDCGIEAKYARVQELFTNMLGPWRQ